MKIIEEQDNLYNKKILLRLDLNVPLKNEKIIDTTRIDKILPTLDFLVKKNSKIIIISHIGRPNGKINKKLSMLPVSKYLSKKLNIEVKLIDEKIFNVDPNSLFKLRINSTIPGCWDSRNLSALIIVFNFSSVSSILSLTKT